MEETMVRTYLNSLESRVFLAYLLKRLGKDMIMKVEKENDLYIILFLYKDKQVNDDSEEEDEETWDEEVNDDWEEEDEEAWDEEVNDDWEEEVNNDFEK